MRTIGRQRPTELRNTRSQARQSGQHSGVGTAAARQASWTASTAPSRSQSAPGQCMHLPFSEHACNDLLVVLDDVCYIIVLAGKGKECVAGAA